MELFEYLDLNGALEVHGASDKGTNHLRWIWIILQRNGSSVKGKDLPKGGLEKLGVVWSNLE